jgi:hypothetical protein
VLDKSLKDGVVGIKETGLLLSLAMYVKNHFSFKVAYNVFQTVNGRQLCTPALLPYVTVPHTTVLLSDPPPPPLLLPSRLPMLWWRLLGVHWDGQLQLLDMLAVAGLDIDNGREQGAHGLDQR